MTTLDDFRRDVSKPFIGFLWANLVALAALVLWQRDPNAPAILAMGATLCLVPTYAVYRDPIGFQTRLLASFSAVRSSPQGDGIISCRPQGVATVRRLSPERPERPPLSIFV